MGMFHYTTQGTDPEFAFIDGDGNTIPAGYVFKKVLDKNNVERGDTFFLGDKEFTYDTIEKSTNGIDYEVPVIKGRKPYGHGYDKASYQAHVDGYLVEFTTIPVTCRNWVVQEVAAGYHLINDIAKAADPNYSILVSPSITLTDEQLSNLPVEATMFGCEPDLDIYGKAQSQCVDASKLNIRPMGGHMHSSFSEIPLDWFDDEEDFYDPNSKNLWYARNYKRLAPIFDRIVGIASVALSGGEQESNRRKYYGQAGRVRVQAYGGIEYRTPSNWWLRHPLLVNYMTLLMQLANNVYANEEIRDSVSNLASLKEVVRMINESDVDSCYKLFTQTLELLRMEDGISQHNHYTRDGNYYHQMSNMFAVASFFYTYGGANNVISSEQAVKAWTKVRNPEYGEYMNIHDFNSTLFK